MNYSVNLLIFVIQKTIYKLHTLLVGVWVHYHKSYHVILGYPFEFKAPLEDDLF